MSLSVAPQIASNISNDHLNEPTPPPAPAPRDSSSDYGQPGPAPAPRHNEPAQGARETVTQHHKELDEMTEERLQENPEYVALKAKQDVWGDMETVFAAIEDHTCFAGDQKISLRDLEVLRDDPNADPHAKEAANRLLNNRSIWNELATGLDGVNDNLVGAADVGRCLERMKTGLAGMKETARAEVMGEMAAERSAQQGGTGAAHSPATGAAHDGGTASSAAPAEGKLFKAPTPSTKGGMEGAVENVNNTLAAVGDAANALMAQLANPDLSPAERTKLQAKYNDLQQLQQMLTAMYAQLQQNISNLMKMYSDAAQNSIHNMK